MSKLYNLGYALGSMINKEKPAEPVQEQSVKRTAQSFTTTRRVQVKAHTRNYPQSK
ncbi:hypothetical protein [Moritella marina]|uniref:hypothetical protein n=1 Tax=Moritella marina TaxID=90736 RepID=UPI0003164A36|nr:hypothetical protein [Moritella marina]